MDATDIERNTDSQKIKSITLENGGTYIGELLNGKPEGKGKYIYPKSEYEGYFKNGKKHGQGVLKFNNDYIYIGDYEEGFAHGKGTLYFCNEILYQGD